MEYQITEKNRCIIINIRGAFDRTAIHAVRGLFPFIMTTGIRDIVLDLSLFECVRSDMVHITGFMNRMRMEAGIHGCSLHLGFIPRQLKEYLETTGTDRIFTLHEGTDEAVRSLSPGDTDEAARRIA